MLASFREEAVIEGMDTMFSLHAHLAFFCTHAYSGLVDCRLLYAAVNLKRPGR